MATTTESSVPVLSFPAILRNPGLTGRYAHLQEGGGMVGQEKPATKAQRREQAEGKRWLRRKDNDRFVGNPHIVAASRKDYTILPTQIPPTFPEPLPSYLPRTVKLPTTPSLPVTDPASANAGRFSLSLKGMRRDLRRAGGKAEALVRDVESEMVQWLATGGTLLAPDIKPSEPMTDTLLTAGSLVGTTGAIIEVSRTPLQLIWRISDDAFARYVVHCCARFHEVVSYSKGEGEERLTYLLRPNVTRPDRRVPAGLETPPITDIDYSSNPDTDIDSEFISEREFESDSDLDGPKAHPLSRIAESPLPPSSPVLSAVRENEDTSWSVLDEEESADDFESASEFESALEGSVEVLAGKVESLAVSSHDVGPVPEGDAIVEAESDKVAEIRALQAQSTPRRRDWVSARSASSPSRSPARRRTPRRRRGAKGRQVSGLYTGKSFYEYLFL